MAYVMLTDRELTAQQTCNMACAACNMWQHSYCSLNYHTLTGLYGIKVGVDEKLVKEGESSCNLYMYYLIKYYVLQGKQSFFMFSVQNYTINLKNDIGIRKLLVYLHPNPDNSAS